MSAVNDVVKICPKCGSGKTKSDPQSLVNNDRRMAWCMACGWSGPENELLACSVPQSTGLTPTEMAVAQAVSDMYLQRLAANAAQAIGLSMIEAGVIGRFEQKELGRLIRAAVLGAHRATLAEVDEMQKEIADGGRPNDRDS